MPQTSCQHLIRYYLACYQADNRDLTFFNVFHRNCEQVKFVTGEEQLITTQLPRLPLQRKHGAKLLDTQTLYKREKTLLYGSFLVTGKLPASYQGNRSVCAPLIYYHAAVSLDNDEYYLNIDHSKPIVNWPLMRWIMADGQNYSEPDFIRKGISARDVAKFSHWLTSQTNAINCLELYLYPKLQNEADVKTKLDQVKDGEFNLTSASCISVVKYSLASRGILHDLKTIAAQDVIPPAFTEFLTGKRPPIQETVRPHAHETTKAAIKPAQTENIPGLISQAQSQAIENAAQFPLSQIIGPPGTGKSYTIACLALERYLQGESTLVVGQNNDSVNVVADKLEALLGQKDFVMRVGNASYHKKLKAYVDDLLNGFFSASEESVQQRQQIHQQKRLLDKLEKRFAKRCHKAIRYGNATWQANQRGTLWSKIKAWSAKRATLRHDSLFEIFGQITQQHKVKDKLLSYYISQSKRERLFQVLQQHRPQLQRFQRAIQAQNSAKQAANFEHVDFSMLLQAMPVWLGTLGDLHRSIPLQQELFDLVIIDEASQCDIASVLPAIYRAKKIVVVGDPKQLRFLSFLSSQKQAQLQYRHYLDATTDEHNYRTKSALDLAGQHIQQQSAIAVLDEHFRSKSALIDFSNRKFYHNQLKLMRHKPGYQESSPLHLQFGEGQYQNGRNREEAIRLLKHLNQQLKDYQHKGLCPSIGILSPFREQSLLLHKLIHRSMDPQDIERFKIKVATAYGFQGDERDVMYLSMCVDKDCKGAQYRYMNREDVFNVAITRARDEQFVFLSVPEHKIHSHSLLFDYVQSALRQNLNDLSEESSFDAFQGEVERLLTLKGVQSWKNYPIAGAELDLVCRYQNRVLALDLIGYPGESQDYFHLSRYKIFQRAGVMVYPLTYTRWYYQKHSVVKEILTLLAAEPSGQGSNTYQATAEITKPNDNFANQQGETESQQDKALPAPDETKPVEIEPTQSSLQFNDEQPNDEQSEQDSPASLAQTEAPATTPVSEEVAAEQTSLGKAMLDKSLDNKSS